MKSLKTIFNEWAQKADNAYIEKQWILSKWEILDGIDWPASKIDLLFQTIRRGLKLNQSDSLVDIGCGGGWIFTGLKPHARKVTGLDFSLEMLKHAQIAGKGSDLICGDALHLPVKDGSFDCAICYFVFVNFSNSEDVTQAIREMMRVLKKGGRALIGHVPDRNFSSVYDVAKKEYLEYCHKTFAVGKNIRDDCLIQVYTLERKFFMELLEKEKIAYQIRDSFNPFYRPGQPETVEWRFDVVLEKN